MENCDVPVPLRRRTSARQAEVAKRPRAVSRCPCCRDQEVSRHSSAAANPPQKRKRSSAPRPSRPALKRPEQLPGTIPPAELPAFSAVPPSPKPSRATNQLSSAADAPLKIHSCSVEEYQQIYHTVADDLLRFKNGRARPYSLEMGRRMKHKLWERLDRPTFTSSVTEDGLVHVDVSYGARVVPPQYYVDTSGEPEPGQPPRKRAKTSM